jgi:methyl-accepting chemotaxis protein
MADGSVTIKEIRAKFTADIQDYRQKMQALSSSIAGMDSKLEGIKRKAQAAMDSPSKSTQKLGRALNAATDALQKNQQRFEDITRAGERTAKEMEKVSQKMAEMGKTYQAIMDAKASGVDLGTPIQKQMDAASEKVDQLYNRISNLKQQLAATKGTNYTSVFDGDEMVNVADVGARLQKLTREAEEAGQAVVKLATAIDKIGESNLNLANESGLARLRKQMEASAEKADKLSEKLSQSGKKAGEMADKVRQNSQTLNQNAKSLSRTSALYNALSSAGDRLGKGLSSVKNKIAGIGNTSRSSTGRIESLLRSIRRISLVHLGLRLTRSLFGKLSTAVTRYMDTNDAAAASINRLRNGLTNALAPAINLCVNLLSKVMPYLIGIVDAVASLITNIFGEGWTTVSTGAGAAADATKDVADKTKDAAKAQKEYNKLVAGFDEIEKLEKQSDAGGSGGSGGSGGKAKQDKADGAEGIAGKLPKWLESLIHDIDDLLDKGNFYGIGTRISETLNSATKAVDDWFNNVLRPKGVLWAGRFADVFNGLVEGYDWGLLGDTISDGLLAAIDIAGTFIRNARFESLGKGIATGINRAIKRINESDINFGSFLADLLNAGIRGLYGFASTVKWSQIGTFVANNVNKFFKKVDWKKAGRTAGKLIAGLGEMLVTAISKISISEVARAFSDFLESAGISKSLAIDIALLFTVAKGVKIANAICGAIGLGATTSMAGISGIALPITLAVGSVMVMQGVAGLLHAKVKTILKEAGYDPDKDFNSNGTRKGNEHWYNSKVNIGDIWKGIKDFFTFGNDKGGVKWKQETSLGYSSGRVAQNTQKATEKGAKASTDGWSWLKRVGVSASAVAKGTSAKIKTVSTINQSGKNTQTVGVKLAQDGWGSVGDWVQEHIGSPVAKAVGLGRDKWEYVSSWVGERLGGGVSKVIGLGQDGWSSVSGWVKEHFGGGVSKGIGLLKDGWSSVKDWVNDRTGGGVSKLISLAKNGWSSVSSWVSNFRTGVSAKVSLVKQGWRTLSGFIGSFTKRIGLKLTWNNVSGWRAAVAKVLFGKSQWPSLRFAARGGVVDGATLFGNTVVGEAGKEAIIPLERNTEWTGQVAKLLARHLYGLPQPIAPSTYSNDNAISGSDMAELVALLRAIRSDVAAVRQSSGGSVTVNTNLDGRTIARSTIDYINGQAKATGVNPLAAYM